MLEFGAWMLQEILSSHSFDPKGDPFGKIGPARAYRKYVEGEAQRVLELEEIQKKRHKLSEREKSLTLGPDPFQ